MVNELQTAFKEIADMRSLPEDVVLDALQSALVSAYRRDSGASSAQGIEARIDPTTGRARIFVEKEVAEDVFSPDTEVTLEKARFYVPEAQIGDTVMVQVEHTTKKFGRIAAQTAKQVILQKIREAERNALFDEFIDKEGDLVMGKVQSMNSSVVTLRLNDRAEAILPRAQQIPGERYRQHEQLRVYLLEVKRSNKGPQIVVSRSHRNMLRRLLEYEVPEIYNLQVEIKSIAREAGYRSKVAVAALQDGIDPVGACVGMRGIRIQNIVKELHGEKIDVIEWSSDPIAFISKALSPARVTGVYLDDDIHAGRTAVVLVPDDMLSLAIGREGQNARLAAKLTGWRIDIKSVTETVIGGLQNLDVPPLDSLLVTHATLIADVRTIMAKRDANKAIMPEEFNTIGKFASLVESRLHQVRQEMREAELEQIEAVRTTLPEALFEVPVDVLGLEDDISMALAELGTVGDLMLAMLTDDPRLAGIFAEIGEGQINAVQLALDALMEADLDLDELSSEEIVDSDESEVVGEADIAEAVVVATPEIQQDVQVPEVVIEPELEVEPEPDLEVIDDITTEEAEEEEILLDAFGGVIEDEDELVDVEEDADVEVVFEFDDDFDMIEELDKPKKKKTDRRKRRRLVFDEESGEVIAKRRRKRNRRRDEWEDLDG